MKIDLKKYYMITIWNKNMNKLIHFINIYH